MQPHMSRDDMLMFYRYLAKSKSYFEFGSGGSTYQASIRDNIQRIVSVESDFEWHTKLKSLIKIHVSSLFIVTLTPLKIIGVILALEAPWTTGVSIREL